MTVDFEPSSRHCDNCGAAYRPDLGHSCKTRTREPGPDRSDGDPWLTMLALAVGLALAPTVVWLVWRLL